MWGLKQKGTVGPKGRMNPYVAIDRMESNFSDHFVVRRKPIPTLIDEAEVLLPTSRPLESEFDQVGDHEIQQRVVDGDVYQYARPQGRADHCQSSFGKRPKTPGYSPVLEGKRLYSDAKQTSPVFTSFRSHVSPVPGCAQPILETDGIFRSISDHKLQSARTVPNLLEEESSLEPNRSRSPESRKMFTALNDKNSAPTKAELYSKERFSLKAAVENSNGSQMSMSQIKPNVYRIPNSVYYPSSIPKPIAAAIPTYSSSPYLHRNPARGDATAAGIEVCEDRAATSTSGIPRPKTVDSSLMMPRPRPTVTSSGQHISRPGTFYPTLDHSNSNRRLNFKQPRQDIISPLSSYHAAIRPYLTVEDGPSSNDPYQLGYMCRITSNPWTDPIFTTCSQKSPIPMALVFDNLVNIRKVGEGVYGEVYKAYFRGMTEQRVYKVVPIEGTKIVNGEKQKKFSEIEPEIIVSQELNKLRQGYNGCYTDGHASLLFTRITQGKYPAILVEQWKTWHRSYVSQNDLPEFDLNQLFAIFELEFHGTDIESFKFRNAKQSLAVLLNVVHALGAAEAASEFEHRDLHWGNILVVKTKEPYTTHTIQGTSFRVPNCGLKSTIIDYTISRLTSSAGQPIFTDLADDEDQFCGSEDYQFEIYRMMRKDNGNDWSRFCPKSNIFWCHYLVGKLIEKGRYSDTTSATHLRFKNRLFRFQSNVLKYSSCMECARRFLHSFCRDLETESNYFNQSIQC